MITGTITWSEERIDHIARHGVTPSVFEYVCFGKSIFRRPGSKGKSPVYYVYGRTEAGRYFFCVVVLFPDGNGYPITAREMTEKSTSKGDTPMKKSRIPSFQTVQEMAEFWDTHDSTDFEDEMEVVEGPLFVRPNDVHLRLNPSEAKAVRKMAKVNGVTTEELIRGWVLQQIAPSRTVRRRK